MVISPYMVYCAWRTVFGIAHMDCHIRMVSHIWGTHVWDSAIPNTVLQARYTIYGEITIYGISHIVH